MPEAQAIGMIGVIRSLGRAGYRVHALSAQADALGLRSAYAAASAHHPPYGSADFAPWLRHYLQQHNIRIIVPSEAFLLGLRHQIADLLPLMPDAPQQDLLYRAFSKCDVQRRLQAVGDPDTLAQQPRARVVQRGDDIDLDAYTQGWTWPLFVKTDGLHAEQGQDAGVHAVHSPAQLTGRVEAALRTHRCCLVQEAVPGVKATVNLWRHGSEIRAQSMALALHENPYSGGLTSDRVLWWHEAMAADARRRLALLEWQGVAMVEYRWHAPSRRFWFLELNARYWNALNLDLFADKDFPRWQVDGFTGRGLASSMDPGPIGLRARYTVPAEVGHVLSKCRAPEVPRAAKLRTLLGFVADGLRPSVRSDLWFPGDRGLYWQGLARFVRQIGHPH